MKKAKKKFLGITHLFFLLLMTNCTTEETNKNEIDPHLSETKIWYNSHQKDYNATVLKYIKELQWQNAIVTDGNAGQVTEVPFVLKDGLSVSNKTSDLFNNQHRLMFIKNEQNEFNLLYVQIFTDKKSDKTLDKSYNYYNLQDDFDGAIYVQELKTNIKNRLEFKNGDRIKSSSQTAKSDEKMCLYYGYWYDDGHFEPLVELGCYGSPEEGGRDKPIYGGGGSGGGTTPRPTESCPKGYIKKFGECVLDYSILTDATFVNNPCLKSVYDKLEGSETFQNYLKKFDGKFSVANLKLAASSTMPSNVNAETNPPQNYLIQITMNSNNLNRPGLDIARTFLHEMIHAEMFRVLLSLSSSNGNIDVATLNKMLTQHNYPGMYDYYTRFGINGMQHEQMAAHYRGIMVSFLKEYDNTLTAQEYESIAWEGLKGTTSWNSKSSQEKQNITDTYNSWKSRTGNNCN